jgi:PAS domain-containing protein
VRYEVFNEQLHEARARGANFYARATGSKVHEEPDAHDGLLPEALAELAAVLEELRVTEDQLRQLTEDLDARWAPLQEQSRRDRALFEESPDCAVVTDRLGVVLRANRAAVDLFGLEGRLLAGRPLTGFISAGQRGPFLSQLRLVAEADRPLVWRMRLHPRHLPPVIAEVRVAAGADGRGGTVLRWSIRPLGLAPAPARHAPASPEQDAAETEAALAGGVASALPSVVDAAAELFQAAGAGVMLLDAAGTLRWVTASGQTSRIFERAQARLGEGPCLDALTQNETIMTMDVGCDPRWPRLAPIAAAQGVAAVICAPIDDAGTFNVMLSHPVEWTPADDKAVRAFAGVAAAMLGVAATAGRKGALAGQLQHALDQRIVVEQAKGVLMEREGLTEKEAWSRLRTAARNSQRKVRDVAKEILGGSGPGAP